MKRILIAGVLFALASLAHAQQAQINCAPATPCNSSTGPANTGTGDPAWTAFGKVNSNESQLFTMFGASGILKGHGAVPNVLTAAGSADVISLWSGSCSSSTFLRGDGSCQTPGGSGTVTTTGSPANGNLTKFSGATSVTNGDLSGDVTTSGTLAATVVKVNGAAVPTSAALLASNGSQQLTAVSTGAGLTIASATLSATQAVDAQTGTSYTVASTDAAKLLTTSNASAIAITLPQATGSFGAGYAFDYQNLGTGGFATITPTTSTINGAASMLIGPNSGCSIVSDGTNHQVGPCPAINTMTRGVYEGVLSVSTATSITPNCTYRENKITASATGTFTLNNPGTCTPYDGQVLRVRVTSPAGGTVTYAEGTGYEASATLAFPATSNAASKTDEFAFEWSSDASKWLLMAYNLGFT